MNVNLLDHTPVQVPTINDSFQDFKTLFGVKKEIFQSDKPKILQFNNCNFLRPNAVAFLGGIVKKASNEGIKVIVGWQSMKESIKINLAQNGFLGSIKGTETAWEGNSINFRNDLIYDYDTNDIINYLTDEWLGEDRISLSTDLKDLLAGKMWEIYANSFIHSKSNIGVFSCGQYFPNGKEIALCIIDFGCTIPFNVNNYLRSQNLSPGQAIRWAFGKGNTTLDRPGGSGLETLDGFIRLNKGRMLLVSGKGLSVTEQSGTNFYNLKKGFNGTIVNINIVCDDYHYDI